MSSFKSPQSSEDYGGQQALRPIRTSRKTGTSPVGKDEGDSLSPISRMFHHPESNLYVMAIMGWKKNLNVEVVKANLVHTLLKHPRFSSLQVVEGTKTSGKMRWVPAEVDLDNHIIIPDMDPGMNSPEKFVEDYISNISKTEIDMSRPLWDLHILNVKTSEAEAVSVLRMHHSLGDGISLMSVLFACTRQTDKPESLPTFPGRKWEISQSRKNDFWHYIVKFWLFLRIFWNTILDVLMLIATAIFLEDSESPIKVPTGSRPTHVRVIHRTVSLEDVKLLKNAMNTTVNDVVLGVTQAALSRYLCRRYGEDEKEKTAKKPNKILEGIRFRAAVMINLRPARKIDALAEMMKKNNFAVEGNSIGFILFPINIAVHDDPLDYVRQSKTIMDRKKQSLGAIFSAYITNFILKIFGFKAAAALFGRIPAQTTIVFSNVAGPVEEISFYGHPMEYLYATCYGQPHGLMIHALSYASKLTFAISVDERVIQDPHQLGEDIVQSLDLIKNAAIP